MPNLNCVGKDGQTRTFIWTYTAPSMVGESHTFFIATDPLPASNNRFQMTLDDIVDDPDSVCLVMSQHFDEPAYASMGIAEAMIPVIAGVLGKNVKSSSGTDLGSGHYRLPRATAYWKRTARATYDEAEDVYTYPRPAPAGGAAVDQNAEAAAGGAAPAPKAEEKKDEAG